MRWKEAMRDDGSRAGRAFEVSVQILIVVSLLAFSIETLPGLSAQTRALLRGVEIVSVMIFSAEYLLRLWAAPRAWRYATSFLGMVDLLAIAPFYFELAAPSILGANFLWMRAMRFLRVLKFLRYNKAIQHFEKAFRITREELIAFLSVVLILFYFAAAGIYFFEHKVQPDEFGSVFHALWWALATLTTVGYGDVYPVTPGGRIFTFFVVMIAIGVVAIPSGLFASALTQIREEEAQKEREAS